MSDPNQPGPLTGPEKLNALSDLKAELFAFQNRDDQSGLVDTAHAYLSHPNLSDESLEVLQRISRVLSVGTDELTAYPNLPMPGDPAKIEVIDSDGVSAPYYHFAKKQILAPIQAMVKRFGVVKAPQDDGAVTGLLKNDIEAFEIELSHQFEHEFEKNNASSNRMRQQWNDDPESIRLDEAVLSEKVRGVSATTLEKVDLLIMHPEMEAISDFKIICTLDPEEYYDALADYRQVLRKIGEESERYLVVLIPSEEQVQRPRRISGSGLQNVSAQKRVIAEIYDSQSDAVIEVVEKLNEYAFPEGQKLKGVLPNMVNGKNVLPLYSQIVLRVKRDRSNEADVQDAADQTGMFIPRGMSTAAMKITAMRDVASRE
jgi:hypothetical protein